MDGREAGGESGWSGRSDDSARREVEESSARRRSIERVSIRVTAAPTGSRLDRAARLVFVVLVVGGDGIRRIGGIRGIRLRDVDCVRSGGACHREVALEVCANMEMGRGGDEKKRKAKPR
jgi:hypothetical protein